VHPHITLANAYKAIGRHLEPGTQVFTVAVITLGVLDDNVDLSRVDDWTIEEYVPIRFLSSVRAGRLFAAALPKVRDQIATFERPRNEKIHLIAGN
jgi:hypothetical protein